MTGITRRGIARILTTPEPVPLRLAVERVLTAPYSGPPVPKWCRYGRWSECGTWLVNQRGDVIYP